MSYYVEKTITDKNGQITVCYSGPFTKNEAIYKAIEDTYTEGDYSQVCRIIS